MQGKNFKRNQKKRKKKSQNHKCYDDVFHVQVICSTQASGNMPSRPSISPFAQPSSNYRKKMID